MADGTTLANAYVQILPSTKGMKKNLDSEMNGAGASSGGKFSAAFKGAISTAAIGAAMGKSLMEGAALEQSLGGVETLFKKNANTVIKNADKAWKTAGLSANAYMEQATSFSASLLQSLDGDTKKAASAADQAIIDMADNANKMGTDIGSIQNAYQGFAKQNYTMLDNLKLGYGGTKEEMDRLLKDAQKISGQEYDMSNLADVYEAIHVIQGELDITGTTSKEAATTLAGSFASMKSALSNFMGNLALGRNVKQAMVDLSESAGTFLFGNLMPAVGNILKSLPVAVKTFISQGIPKFMESGKELLDGILKGMTDSGDMIGNLGGFLEKLSGQLLTGSQKLVDVGMKLLQKLAEGIADGMPKLVKRMPKIISNLADIINKNAPKLLKGGVNIVLTLVKGIIKTIPVLVKSAPEIFKAFLKVWQALNWLNLGRLALNAVKKGMTAVIKTIGPYVKAAFTRIKNFMFAPIAAVGVALSGVIKNIKSKFSFGDIAAKVRTAFSNVKTAITSPIRKAKETLSGIVDKIKGMFPISGGKMFSGLKLPKVKFAWTHPGGLREKGAKLLGLPGFPGLELKWNAKAMNQPYMFSDATLFGAGEAGDEVLYGRQALMRDIAQAVGNAAGGAGGTLSVIINLDGKTIGQATVDYLNGQTLMFGTSPALV